MEGTAGGGEAHLLKQVVELWDDDALAALHKLDTYLEEVLVLL